MVLQLLTHLFARQLDVHRCGLSVGMTQYLLQDSKARPLPELVDSEGVSKRLDGRTSDAGILEVLAHYVLDRTRAHPPPELALEDDVVLGVRRPSQQVAPQCLAD